MVEVRIKEDNGFEKATADCSLLFTKLKIEDGKYVWRVTCLELELEFAGTDIMLMTRDLESKVNIALANTLHAREAQESTPGIVYQGYKETMLERYRMAALYERTPKVDDLHAIEYDEFGKIDIDMFMLTCEAVAYRQMRGENQFGFWRAGRFSCRVDSSQPWDWPLPSNRDENLALKFDH